jgi:hypothetical protein
MDREMRLGQQSLVRAMAIGVMGITIAVPFSPSSFAQSQQTRASYTAIPLGSIKQLPIGGDPNQLPLMFLSGRLGKKSSPQMTLDRSNPQYLIATITLTDPAVAVSRYRVEMVPNQSPCSCQGWKVVWVGQQ